MRKAIILAAMSAILASPSLADTLQKGQPVCLSEDLYRQLALAVVQKDIEALNWLAQNGCIISYKAFHATVLGGSDDGVLTHIRIYRGNVSAEVWVAAGSLEGDDPLNPSSAQ